MILHVYAMNWNEERLLPAFFEHYKQADLITILDNESTDRSHEIMKQYGATIIPFKTNNTLCDMYHMQMKNTVWKKSKGVADWVIVQDLDEFLFFPQYPGDLKAGLQALSEKGVTICKTRGFNMFCSDEEFNDLSNVSFRLASSVWNGHRMPNEKYYDKSLAFNPNKINEIGYSEGAHGINPSGNGIKIDSESALLLHYKYIGKDYVSKRYMQIRDRLSKDNMNRGWGNQYRRSDEIHVRQIAEYFAKYSSNSLFRMMYPDAATAGMKFRGKQFLMATHGAQDILSNSLLGGGVWEPRVAEAIYAATSKPGTVFLDIGANLGAHTAIARTAGCRRIHAFECNPSTAMRLRKTIELNGWESDITLHEVAVSDVRASYPFVLVPDNLGASYISTTHKGWPGAIKPTDEVQSAVVDEMPIDISGAEAIVVKLDIEGHELNALRGMKRFLADERLRDIFIELNPVCNPVAKLLETVELIQSYGFNHAKLLFQAPGDAWAGAELGVLPSFPDISNEQIHRLLEQNHVLEVLFIRSAPPQASQ